MRVIGIGGRAGHGKSMAANAILDMLVAEDVVACIRPFASELKRIALQEFGWDGQKDEKGRRLLQVLGTEAGREHDKDIWIKRLEARIRMDLPDRAIVIVDDCRFVNEVQWCNSHGVSVLLHRSGVPELAAGASQHASEREFDQAPWMLRIENNGSLLDLKTVLRYGVLEKFGFLASE